MEKVILTLRGVDADDAWCARLRAHVAANLLDIGLPGLAINVRDAEVRDSLMTLTTMDPPVVAFVSVWVQQSYGTQLQAAKALLQKECGDVAAYLVTESVPLPPPPTVAGQRTAGLANVVGISAGALHSLALRRDGTVVAWGDNTYKQLAVPAGLGSTRLRLIPR